MSITVKYGFDNKNNLVIEYLGYYYRFIFGKHPSDIAERGFLGGSYKYLDSEMIKQYGVNCITNWEDWTYGEEPSFVDPRIEVLKKETQDTIQQITKLQDELVGFLNRLYEEIK